MGKDGSDLLVQALRRAHTDVKQLEDGKAKPDPPDAEQEAEPPSGPRAVAPA